MEDLDNSGYLVTKGIIGHKWDNNEKLNMNWIIRHEWEKAQKLKGKDHHCKISWKTT